MSWIEEIISGMKLFGFSPAADANPKVSATDSIRAISEALDVISKRIIHLDKKMEDEVAKARKEMARKNKRGALMCLKRKQMFLAEANKLSGAQMTLEQQKTAVEGSKLNELVVGAMKTGNAAMRTLNGTMSVEETEDLMRDVEEDMKDADKINYAISQPLGGQEIEDDDDLLAELEALEQDDLDAQLTSLEETSTTQKAAAMSKMPAAPTHIPRDDDEDAFNQLAEDMAF